MTDFATPPEMVVMLTHRDRTVANAIDVFESCKELGVSSWGFKDVGLALPAMRDLATAIRDTGASVYLEIVSLTTAEMLAGIEAAAACACGTVMGSTYSKEAREAAGAHGLRYMPFIGVVHSHPSILEGSIEEIAADASHVSALGVDGIDLLTYRHIEDDPARLLGAVVDASSVPVDIGRQHRQL